MKRWLLRALIVLIILAAVFSGYAQQSSLIRLIVVISVDQMRADYLIRFQNLYSGGFRYLLDNGAVFTDAHQEHSFTETAVGHSTILTGLLPSTTGIVGNNWYDINLHRTMYCVSDSTVAIVGAQSNRGGVSFKNVHGSTLGDWLKTTDKKAKVYAAARKDRAAVLLGGQQPDGVFWYNTSNGSFISSTAYMASYPAWLVDFNNKEFPNRAAGTVWERLVPDEKFYVTYSRQDSFPGEARGGNSTKFPHNLGNPNTGSGFYTSFGNTPRMGEYLIELAKTIIQNEQLGNDSIVDILALSFSETDAIGHSYGPFSQEAMDGFLRLDIILGTFFTYLDKTVGLPNCVIVLTGDHGVMALPEYLQSQGIDSKRVQLDVRGLDRNLADKFGAGKWIESSLGTILYINRSLLQTYKIEYKTVETFIADEVKKWDFVERVYTRSELLEKKTAADDFYYRLFQNSFNTERSGDIFIRLKENYMPGSGEYGASHGSPYSYDTHVPLIFVSNRLVKGTYNKRVATVDIAPTLARISGIPIRGRIDGRVLTEIIR